MPSSKQPSLVIPITGSIVFLMWAAVQIINLVQWDGYMGLPAWTRIPWLLFDLLMFICFVLWWDRVSEIRQSNRKVEFAKSDPWPELEPATDWQEIDRAMGALIAKGVDPTFERAKDWLRHEADHKRHSDLVERRTKLMIERGVDPTEAKMLAKERSRQNPFLRGNF